jgi:hypothetical protein
MAGVMTYLLSKEINKTPLVTLAFDVQSNLNAAALYHQCSSLCHTAWYTPQEHMFSNFQTKV